MSKLHELLAVEADLEGVYKNIVQETETQFTKHPDRYIGQVTQVKFFDENAPAEADVNKELDDTVMEKLEYSAGHIARYLDAVLQKETTNQIAKADLIVDGKKIAADVPATFLLGLENKLKYIRAMYENAPTLAPGIKWELDPTQGKGVYKMSNPEEKFRTKKVFKNHVIAEATKEHPAQVQTYSEDERIARVITNKWCGMITPAAKSELLGRFDELLRAVKKARQVANSAEVVNAKIGREILNYINGSSVTP